MQLNTPTNPFFALPNRRWFIIAASALVLPGCERNDAATPPSPAPPPAVAEVLFDIVTFLSNHPVLKLLSLLKIIDSVDQLAGGAVFSSARQLVGFRTLNPGVNGFVSTVDPPALDVQFTTPDRQVEFAPGAFMATHQILPGDTGALEQLDERILADYAEATQQVLDSGTSNFIEQLHQRVAILREKGYDDNSLHYVLVKHQNYPPASIG